MGWEDSDASRAAEAAEPDPQQKRSAYVRARMTTGSGMGSDVNILPYDQRQMWVPYCGGVAVSGAYKVTQLPFMIAACMTFYPFIVSRE